MEKKVEIRRDAKKRMMGISIGVLIIRISFCRIDFRRKEITIMVVNRKVKIILLNSKSSKFQGVKIKGTRRKRR